MIQSTIIICLVIVEYCIEENITLIKNFPKFIYKIKNKSLLFKTEVVSFKATHLYHQHLLTFLQYLIFGMRFRNIFYFCTVFFHFLQWFFGKKISQEPKSGENEKSFLFGKLLMLTLHRCKICFVGFCSLDDC